MAPFTQQAVAPHVDSLALSSFLGLPSLAYELARSPTDSPPFLPGILTCAALFTFLVLLPLTLKPASPTTLPPPVLPESGSFVHLSSWPLVSRAPPSCLGISTSAHTSGTLKHRLISLCFFTQYFMPRVLFPLSFHLPPFILFPPVEISTWLYLLSNGFRPLGPFQPRGPSSSAPPPGRKQDGVLGEACGIWDLRPLPERRTGRLLPHPQLSWVSEWPLQTPVAQSYDS